MVPNLDTPQKTLWLSIENLRALTCLKVELDGAWPLYGPIDWTFQEYGPKLSQPWHFQGSHCPGNRAMLKIVQPKIVQTGPQHYQKLGNLLDISYKQICLNLENFIALASRKLKLDQTWSRHGLNISLTWSKNVIALATLWIMLC